MKEPHERGRFGWERCKASERRGDDSCVTKDRLVILSAFMSDRVCGPPLRCQASKKSLIATPAQAIALCMFT